MCKVVLVRVASSNSFFHRSRSYFYIIGSVFLTACTWYGIAS